MSRPDFIKHINDLIVEQSFSYPGDTETFGIGAAMGRKLELNRIGIVTKFFFPEIAQAGHMLIHMMKNLYLYSKKTRICGLMEAFILYPQETVEKYHPKTAVCERKILRTF